MRFTGFRLAAALGCAMALLANVCDAQPMRNGTTHFDLGQGRSADRTMGTTVRGRAAMFTYRWTVTGFTAPPGVEHVAAFAARGRRIVALADTGVHITDNGTTWHDANFYTLVNRPLAIALADGGFGAFVTATQGVWYTNDGGESWRQVRDAMTNTLDDVAVADRTIVFTDTTGGAWTSDESGSLRTLCSSPPTGAAAVLVSDPRAAFVIVHAGACNWRVESTFASEL